MKSKLTSRKFWMAVAAFVVGVLALFQIDANVTQQISGVVMSLGAVVAYIVGEGLVDASAVGNAANAVTFTANTATGGGGAVPQYNAPVIGTVNTSPAETAQTGSDTAAKIKTDTALSESAEAK